MNLRVTPNFNNQQQNSRNTPNFKMRLVDETVVEDISSRFGMKLKEALVVVKPRLELITEFGHWFKFNQKHDIHRKIFANPDLYYTPLDVLAIRFANAPVAKTAELVRNAKRIQISDVENALSRESLRAIDMRMGEINSKSPLSTPWMEVLRSALEDETHNSEAHERNLKRMALWKLFGLY